jgi:hypothetical protein
MAPALCWLLCLANSARSQEERPQPQPVAATVTLTARDRPLKEVLAEVAKKTGVRVESELGEPEPKVSLDVKGELFWKVVDQLAERAGAGVNILPRDGRIVLTRRQADARPPIVSYSGQFRFCLKRVSASFDLDTGARRYTAAVEVAWEPGLQPLFLESYAQEVVAVDDQGTKHSVPAEGRSMGPVDGRISIDRDVPLPALPTTANRLAKLEGHLEAIAPTRMLRFTFPKTEEGAEVTQDGVTCKLSKVVLKDRWIVQVRIENPAGGTVLESYQPWDSNNVMALLSKDGKTRLVANSYLREMESSRRAVISYHFTDRDKLAGTKPEDWSVVYTTPALVVTVPLTFSFKDVPAFKDATGR